MSVTKVLSFLCFLCSLNADWVDEFEHNTFMDLNENFRVFWTVLNDSFIEFGLQVNTKGWIGIGISLNGLMANSDVMIGWIDQDNTTIIQNRYTPSDANDRQAILSDYQDLTLIEGSFIDGVTKIRFIRPVKYIF